MAINKMDGTAITTDTKILGSVKTKALGTAIQAGGAPPVADDTFSGNNNTSNDLGLFGVSAVAMKFTGSSSTDCIQGQISLKVAAGSPTGNLTLELFSHNAGTNFPNAVLTNGVSGNVSASSVTGSFSDIVFTFSPGPSRTATTVYWLVIRTSNPSNSNYLSVGLQNNGAAPPSVRIAQFDGSWSNPSGDRIPNFTLYHAA